MIMANTMLWIDQSLVMEWLRMHGNDLKVSSFGSFLARL